MPSSGMVRHVTFVRRDVSEERIGSIITVTRLAEPILVTLLMKAILSSETSVLTRTTRHKITEDGILHTHIRENLKSYIKLTGWAL
jgi:hypothetical protein